MNSAAGHAFSFRKIPMSAHLLILMLLSGLLIHDFLHLQRFDSAQLSRVHSLIDQLEKLDAETEQFMLQTINHTRFNYDDLTDDTLAMRDTYHLLQSELSDARFRDSLQDLHDSLTTQFTAIDEFKAAFSIWANSSRYLSVLIKQLIAAHPQQRLMLTELNRDVLNWQLYPDNDELKTQLLQQSKILRTTGMEELYRHLQIILTQGGEVLDAITASTTCGTPENAERLGEQFDAFYTQEMDQKRRNEQTLLMLGALLLAYLVLLLMMRQHDQRALRESEQRFRLLFDLIPDAVGIHQRGLWRYVNPAAMQMYGAKSADELIGSPVLERIHPDHRRQVAERIQNEVKKNQPVPLMAQKHLRIDGSSFYAEVQGIPFEERGQQSIMVVARDITQRIHAERESSRLITILEHTSDFVGMADRNGQVLYVNPAGKSLVGLAADHDVQQMQIADFHPEHETARLLHEILPKAEATGSYQTKAIFKHSDGHDITVSAVFTAHQDNTTGKATHFSVIGRDLTAELERNKQLEHTQRLESLGILAGGIAHDFNNILTAIMGNAAMANRGLEQSNPAREQLARIEAATRRASDLCKQMLAYSGKGRFIIKATNLTDLVEDMTRLMEVSIHKNVVIKYHLAENLPAVEIDTAQIQQVILNLITNANEAIGEKSGVISFSTGIMHADRHYLDQTLTDKPLPEGRYVYFEVSDTGCGMDEQTMQHMFDPFFTTKFTGRGLGMSAVLGIVRGHQGAMRVYSELGKGTTFKVLLPVSEQAVAVEESIDHNDSSPLTGTILIVDDEETIREVAAMMLEEAGFDTMSANDGVEALEVYKQHGDRITGVLMDMTMPRMDGKECFRELRRINPDVKVVLSSGYNEQDATSRFVGQGLAGFIQKPYSPEALIDKMREVFAAS